MAELNRGKCRDRGDRNREGGGKNGGGGDHHRRRRGGDSASGAGVPEGAAEGATSVQQPGPTTDLIMRVNVRTTTATTTTTTT